MSKRFADKRLVFMGSDSIAVPLLSWLQRSIKDYGARLEAVLSRPDRPRGRGQKLQPNSVSEYALQHGLALFRFKQPNEDATNWLTQNPVDLVIVMAYGHYLKQSLLAKPSYGFVNLHTSLLPKYRGASPIETALCCGEKIMGITLMKISNKMDAGDIYDSESIQIGEGDSAGVVRQHLAQASIPLMQRQLSDLLKGTAKSTPQDHTQASYCRKLDKVDGVLDFNLPARKLADRINGLDPWPGCTLPHANKLLKVRRAYFKDNIKLNKAPGTIIQPADRSVRIIAGGDSILLIKELQQPGGNWLQANDFLHGYSLLEGTLLENRNMPKLLVS